MKIYTRSGDDGSTSLVGGQRVSKASARLEAYGTVDELISWMGMLASLNENAGRSNELIGIQDRLMHISAILASGKGARLDKTVSPEAKDIESLERSIDIMEKDLPALSSFILPGGSQAISYAHIARTVCRRAERSIVRIDDGKVVDSMLLKYINRLSDYLFILSRNIELATGKKQPKWNS